MVTAWSQFSQPKSAPAPLDVMGLMARAARNAAEQLETPGILKALEGIFVVRSLSTQYPSPADQLAATLWATPKFATVSKVGGNSPQTLINQAAGMIARGELESALVVGAETYVPRGENSAKPDSALMKGIPADYPGDDAIGATALEKRHGMEHPMQGFPLFETALWNASGMELGEHLHRVGTLWSGFNAVAQTHPHAWTRTPMTADEIVTPGPTNRPIAFPYTKFMNSFVTVDQTAAVILMSETAARKLGPQRKEPVYFMGGGYAEDRQRFMIQKSDFTASPPLEAAVAKALGRAAMTLDQLECFDLYSCFPCAVSIARKMLNLHDDDPRPLTLTGGLGFFGGPGNNYNLHAVVTLVDQIANGKRNNGMVTALGWFMHKHAAGIYSNQRPTTDLGQMDMEDRENFLAGPPPLDIDPQPKGQGKIDTYTLIYATDQTPAYAVIYGRTEAGRRFIANTPKDPHTFEALTRKNQIGSAVNLDWDPNREKTIATLL